MTQPAYSTRLWKTLDVATYLGMSPRQVRKLVDAGTLRAVGIDHHLRFDRGDIDQLIAQASAGSGREAAERPAQRWNGRSSTDVSVPTRISV